MAETAGFRIFHYSSIRRSYIKITHHRVILNGGCLWGSTPLRLRVSDARVGIGASGEFDVSCWMLRCSSLPPPIRSCFAACLFAYSIASDECDGGNYKIGKLGISMGEGDHHPACKSFIWKYRYL